MIFACIWGPLVPGVVTPEAVLQAHLPVECAIRLVTHCAASAESVHAVSSCETGRVGPGNRW